MSVDGDAVLPLVSLATAIAGVGLIGVGVRDRRRAATRLECEAPDGSAAAKLRHEALSDSVQVSPPPSDRVASLEWAYSAKAKENFKLTQPIQAEAKRQAGSALEHADEREASLRRTLAANLRGGLQREIVGAVLVVAGAAASAIAALT